MSGKKGKKIDDLVSIFKVARAFSVLQKAELSARVGGPQTSWSPPPPPPPQQFYCRPSQGGFSVLAL